MENPDIDRPAVHIGFPFFAALFVASFFGAPFAAVSAVLLFVAVFLLFLFKQHRQRPNFVLSLIAAAAAFAVFAVVMNLFVLPTERYDGGTYTVTGNVESFLTKSNGRFYYKLLFVLSGVYSIPYRSIKSCVTCSAFIPSDCASAAGGTGEVSILLSVRGFSAASCSAEALSI